MVTTTRLRCLFPLLLLLFAALAPAQSGHDEHPLFGKWRVIMDVAAATAYGPERLISGTKVQVGTNVVPQGNSQAGILPLETVSCTSTRLYVGGTKVDETFRPNPGVTTGLTTGASAGGTATGTNGAGTSGDPGLAARSVGAAGRSFLVAAPQGAGGPTANPWQNVTMDCDLPAVRFASTHFADGAAVPIKLETDWEHLVDGAVQGTTTLSTTLATKAYNKLQTLGTGYLRDGMSFVADPLFETASNKTTSSAQSGLSVSHHVIPGATALQETRATILARHSESTVVSAMTHGDLLGIHSSNGSEIVLFKSLAIPTPISSKINARSGAIPPYNLVGYWACKTINASNLAGSDSVQAYETLAFINRAYIGFTGDVSVDVYPKSIWDLAEDDPDYEFPDEVSDDLGDHATVFWTAISQGDTARQALTKANDEYPPLDGAFSPPDQPVQLPMRLVGDEQARLKYVYLSVSERAARITAGLSINEWYLKLP